MAQRTCEIPGCARKHVARGMCRTHYNKTKYTPEQRHRTHLVACVMCATLVRRRVESTYLPTCSVECRTVLQHGATVAADSSYQWQVDVLTRVKSHGSKVVDRFDRQRIFDRDDWTCQECGVTCSQPDPYNRMAATVDHIVPLALGGEHSLTNVQTLCLSCNSRKSDRQKATAA